jgi:hypothetical protein
MVVGAFKKVADVLRGEAGLGRAQGYLNPIDTERFARDLELDRHARERGKDELPGSTATNLDAHEQQIIQRLESEWSWHGAALANDMKAYASRLLAVTVHTEFARLDLLARDALTKLRSANHRAESELGPLREAYLAARNELAAFREKHRLNRVARNPASRPTTIGWLVILVSVEALANAIFFAKGSDLGLLGGLWTAVCISAINVVVAFAIGLYPLRWINSRNLIIKIFGFITALIGFAGIVIVHGFAAHFREVPSTTTESEAFNVARDATLSNPFLLSDLNSYYLFGIGIVWAIFAISKGYGYDDPYPGYGSHYRRARDAREHYSDEHHDLFDELDVIKNDTVRSIDSGIVRIPLFPQQAAEIREEREALRQKFKGYEASVQTAANQLLARYRDLNRLSRKTTPPKYFDEQWRLPHSFLQDTSVTAMSSDPPTPPMDANDALARLASMSDDVLTEYSALLLKYPHPTQMD